MSGRILDIMSAQPASQLPAIPTSAINGSSQFIIYYNIHLMSLYLYQDFVNSFSF